MTSATSTDQADIAAPHSGEGLAISVQRDSAVTEAMGAVPYLKLLLFYLPLGFSGFIMTLDLPVVNAVLNRLPDPDTSVAALRVAFSLALVYEASHISMIDVS